MDNNNALQRLYVVITYGNSGHSDKLKFKLGDSYEMLFIKSKVIPANYVPHFGGNAGVYHDL